MRTYSVTTVLATNIFGVATAPATDTVSVATIIFLFAGQFGSLVVRNVCQRHVVSSEVLFA